MLNGQTMNKNMKKKRKYNPGSIKRELLPAESIKPLTFRNIRNTGTINSSFQSASALLIILHNVGPVNDRFKMQCLTSRAFLFLYAERYCVGSHLMDLNLDETKLASGITYTDEWCSK